MHIVTLLDPDRVRFKLDVDNAKVTGHHIVFYKAEEEGESLVAAFFLTDVEEAIDLSRIEPFPGDDEGGSKASE